MAITENLGLVIPTIDDFGEQTFIDIENNLNKIDQASDKYVNSIPTSGNWQKDKKIYFNNVGVGDYIGAVNIRSGRACPKWASLTPYTMGQTITPTIDNGHYYTCVQTGTSSPYEPDWLVAAQTVTEDTRNKSVWQPSKAYVQYDIIVPSIDNDRFYVCTVAGTSGTSEPVWSTTNGVATSDNGVVWMTYRIAKWQESGVPANFRPFGKIE